MTYRGAAVLLALGACGGTDSTPARPPATPSGGRIAMAARDNVFDPAAVVVPVGRPTTVVLTNTGAAPHTFTVKEFGVDVEVKAGKATDVTVTPDRAGSFRFICIYHPGMTGELTVA